MVKILSFAFILLLFVPGLVIAGTLPSVQIDKKISTGLEVFFEKTLNKDYEAAYTMMTDNFIKTTSLEDFKLILAETKLTAFTRKVWTGFKKEMLGILATVQGDFFTLNEEVHHITFKVFVDAHDIKIKSINEQISIADLRERFPAGDILKEQVKTDLTSITSFISDSASSDLHAYLSNSAKTKISIWDLRRLMVTFRRSRVDFAPAEDSTIKIKKYFPRLNNNGQMLVEGDYENERYKIHFGFYYDYEWRWRVGGFNFNDVPNFK